MTLNSFDRYYDTHYMYDDVIRHHYRFNNIVIRAAFDILVMNLSDLKLKYEREGNYFLF